MEIPYGYCQCGCGNKTNIVTTTDKAHGRVKGEPHRYIIGHQHHPMRSSAENFWSRVDRHPDKDICWDWKGSTLKLLPYGQTMYRKKMWITHRLSWFLTHGDIPDGLFVLHKCDNPRCCNPFHLFLGTHQDNMADMSKKGRGRNHRTGKWPRDEFGVIQKTVPTPI